MIFSTVTSIFATLAVFGAAHVNGHPTGTAQDAATPAMNLGPCPTTPAEYWQCISDCLYKKCEAGDNACVTSCDYNCGITWVPGFPGCTPEPW